MYKISAEAKNVMKRVHSELQSLLNDSSQFLRMFTFDALDKVSLIKELTSLETPKRSTSSSRRTTR